MNLFRRPIRLAIHGPANGLAYFKVKSGEDPEIQSWDPEVNDCNWRLIRKVDLACEEVEQVPFLHLDIWTPYGESVTEDQVFQGLREALGPKHEDYLIQGWHVVYLENTHMGSNHRVFVSLQKGTSDSEARGWDLQLPVEIAVESLGDWIARKSGGLNFHLILSQGQWVYSLVYLNAQPYHRIRVGRENTTYLKNRLQAHHHYLAQQSKEGPLPLFVYSQDSIRPFCEEIFGSIPLDLPTLPGSWEAVGKRPTILHFGYALAAVQDGAAAHNQVQKSQQSRNSEIRLWNRLVVFAVLGIFFGLLPLALEGIQYFFLQRELTVLQAEASKFEVKVKAIRTHRLERLALWDSLQTVKALWNKPVPLDRVLQKIGMSLPNQSGLEGFVFRDGAKDNPIINFRIWVKDWNQVQPFQDKLKDFPLFSKVEISDQHRDPENARVYFQVSCALVKPL